MSEKEKSDLTLDEIKTILRKAVTLSAADRIVAIAAISKRQKILKTSDLRNMLREFEKEARNQAIISSEEVDEKIAAVMESVILPSDYRVSGSKILSSVLDDKGIRVETIVGEFIAVTAMALDSETGDVGYEITFSLNGEIKSSIVQASDIADKRKLIALSDIGVDVTSVNADALTKYLQDQRNESQKELPQVLVTNRSGWVFHQGMFSYILGKTVYQLNGKQRIHRKGSEDELKNMTTFRTVGDFEKWVDGFNWIKAFPIALVSVGAAAGSLLMRFLDVQNFIVHIWGASTGGKTFLVNFCASMFGDPSYRGQTMTWRTTAVGVEARMLQASDMILVIDDSSQAKSKELISEIVYMIGQGQVKTRGRRDGSIKSAPAVSLVALSSGEEPLENASSKGGQLIRTIQIAQLPFGERSNETGEAIKVFSETIKENFGHIGEKLISSLVKDVNSEGGLVSLRERHAKIRLQLTNSIESPFAVRMADKFAVIKLALQLLSEKIPECHIKEEEIDAAIDLVFKAQLDIIEDQNQIEFRALSYLWDKILQDPTKFTNDPIGERWGVVVTRAVDGRLGYAFTKTALSKVLSEGGFEPLSIIKFFRNRKWVWDRGGDLWSVKMNGTTIKAFVFDEETAIGAGVLSAEKVQLHVAGKRNGTGDDPSLF